VPRAVRDYTCRLAKLTNQFSVTLERRPLPIWFCGRDQEEHAMESKFNQLANSSFESAGRRHIEGSHYA